jgi:hypothetical protein
MVQRGEVSVVGTGSSSLLRLRSRRWVGVALLAGLVTALGAPTAGAAVASPDPSPSPSAPAPDPYPKLSPPAPALRAPAADTSPAPAVQRPASTRQFAPSSLGRTPVTHSSARRQKPQAADTARKVAVEPLRVPVHPAPGLGARVAAAATAAVEPPRRVSRTLALAVALLVLLSAAFVAGAAREAAR